MTSKPDARREQLRQTFNEAAELYDRARPKYPNEIFTDLVALTGLRRGDRVLEIGPGTGQATRPLAERGFMVTAVELGEGLADVARRKLRDLENVEIVSGNFETYAPTTAGYDAIASFTAFHWIDPELRYTRSASLLRPNGVLAVVAVHHVLAPRGDEFFIAVQEDYDAVVPEDEATKGGPPGPPENVPDLAQEIDESDRFENLAARRYLWDIDYTAEEYIDVINTYSGHRSHSATLQKRLYDRIRQRIEARPNGRVRKTYLATLNVARRI